MIDFMDFFQVNLMNPKVLVGAFIGGMAAFLFCGLTMGAVGRAAQTMVNEVRRQFSEIKGILEGKATPDYGRCVEISTRSAQREMVFPSLLAIIIPIVVGVLLGVGGVMGLLVVLRTVWIFNNFDFIYLITGGGPAGSTQTVPVYAYDMGWGTKLLGKSSAVTVLLFLFLMAVCIVYFTVISHWEKEDRK